MSRSTIQIPKSSSGEAICPFLLLWWVENNKTAWMGASSRVFISMCQWINKWQTPIVVQNNCVENGRRSFFGVRPLKSLTTRWLLFLAFGVGRLPVCEMVQWTKVGGTGAVFIGLWMFLPLLLVASVAQRAESPPCVRSLVISLRWFPAHATWDGGSITGGRLRLGCEQSVRRYWAVTQTSTLVIGLTLPFYLRSSHLSNRKGTVGDPVPYFIFLSSKILISHFVATLFSCNLIFF